MTNTTAEQPLYDAYAPNGKQIVAQLHKIQRAGAMIVGFKAPKATSNMDIEFSGWTEVYWDTQAPTRRFEQLAYIDEDGGDWLESDLTFRPQVAVVHG